MSHGLEHILYIYIIITYNVRLEALNVWQCITTEVHVRS